MEEVLDSPRRLMCWLSYSLRRLVKCRKGFAWRRWCPLWVMSARVLNCVRAWRTAGTSVVDGSVEVLRALGSRRKANELVQFLKCCYEAEDEGVQVTTIAVLVLGLASVVDNLFAGSGKQMTVQTEDVAALMPHLPSKKRFQRLGPGTKLMCSIGAIRQKRARTFTSFAKAHRGGSAFAGLAAQSCRDVMVQVVVSSVAWSRRVFAGSDARRICFSADEFNRGELSHDLDLP